MASVTLSGVRKRFGTTEVIRGVDATIADGEFVVIVGPSGCGKSTLLRLVAGLEEASDGDIRIGPRLVNGVEPRDRDIAMVFQSYALYPHMSVFDNMAYGLRIRGTTRPEIERRVREAAAALRLEALLERKPRQLSGGQRQRVAMGRAIVRDPAVFLFDEPLSNLDAQLRVEMRVEIRRLQRSLATTSLYVTHDQVEAMTLADRLIVMNEGLAEQIGTPLELYERPATVFVAGFIGTPPMNLLPASVSADGAIVLADGTALPCPAGVAPGHAGRRVVLGVRPEDLVPDATGPLAFEVELAELLGADTIVHGRLAGARMQARLPGIARLAPGAALALRPDMSRLHLFDEATGRRL